MSFADAGKCTFRWLGSIRIGISFAPTATDRLVIPARIWRRDGATTTLTTIEPAATARAPQWSHVPRRFTVEAVQDLAAWDAIVAAALGAIETDQLRKVVLAREVRVESDTAFSVAEVLATLRRTQAGCFVFASGSFVGATPELLVRRRATSVTSQPMAGTAAREARASEDARAMSRLLNSQKIRVEHQLVVDAVVESLRAHCDEVVAHEPQAIPLTSVTHLATTINGTLRDAATTALDVALALHPTPAVAGTPTAMALETIARLEPFSRGRYGGPVGWVDADGDGEFAVALRCAELDGRNARLLAGAGIVTGSDPDLEWAETQAKLEPMLRALIRP